MLFHWSKSKKTKPKDFYIGEVPSRPGRRQIDLENLLTDQNQAASHSRIGQFGTTSGYHPVRPAININKKSQNNLPVNDPYNTNRIIPINSITPKRSHFFHRQRHEQP
jgi:hypothetical protein